MNSNYVPGKPMYVRSPVKLFKRRKKKKSGKKVKKNRKCKKSPSKAKKIQNYGDLFDRTKLPDWLRKSIKKSGKTKQLLRDLQMKRGGGNITKWELKPNHEPNNDLEIPISKNTINGDENSFDKENECNNNENKKRKEYLNSIKEMMDEIENEETKEDIYEVNDVESDEDSVDENLKDEQFVVEKDENEGEIDLDFVELLVNSIKKRKAVRRSEKRHIKNIEDMSKKNSFERSYSPKNYSPVKVIRKSPLKKPSKKVQERRESILKNCVYWFNESLKAYIEMLREDHTKESIVQKEKFESLFKMYRRQIDSKMKRSVSIQTSMKKVPLKKVNVEKVNRGVDTSDLGSYVEIKISEKLNRNALELSLEKYSSMLYESVLKRMSI